MSGFRFAPSVATRLAALAVVVLAATVATAGAQDTVSISVPLAVNFQVSDVSRSTSGTPSVTRLSFSSANLNGKALRVSVQADAAAFIPPSDPGILVSNVSWTALGFNGSVGSSGTLSSSSYTQVYQSNPAQNSGYIDLGWTLAAPGSGIRAGSHQVMIRWKLESINF